MRGDQFVARKRGPPIGLAARHEDGLALFDYPTLVTDAYVLNCFQNVISKSELI
jgi:hypothetical protein